ncbi:twin-arginine translocation signal domain-containing protein [Mameliella alba]|uniref:Twin-arginine translocation signal domain-containing protein n=1 Tax=Mameliella alba TaxID=561184 RepID=A0A0B3S328_9RHOB|nr:twin-arginine translocation signal domain-containing protein [Mameliella alba]KHQ51091.1 hypothetical protein OA50_04462 [Mameliella alba]
MNMTSRRGFIKSASTAALAATATPALAYQGSEPDTPVMRAYRKWRPLRDRMFSSEVEGLTYEEEDAEWDIVLEAEARVLEAPCQCPQDFIAKVLAASSFGEFPLGDNDQRPVLWAEAEALVEGGLI